MTLYEFQQRRTDFLALMAPDSAALFFAAPERQRNADCDYPFRQDSDFWYLSGFNEPEALLMLIRHQDGRQRTILFNRFKDPVAEVWFGRRLGQEAALTVLGVDEAYSWDELPDELHLLLNGLTQVYHAQGKETVHDALLFAALDKLRAGMRQNWRAPAAIVDWRPLLHEMRLFKRPAELALMRKAGEISALGHRHAMQVCRPGLFEYQLAGEIEHQFVQQGARFPAYNTIVGGGDNACILHYTENEHLLREGDLVLIDAGAEYQNYAGDITRTFPVSGRFSAPQRALYDIVLAAQRAALALCRPGSSIQAMTEAAVRVMVEGLLELGILHGEVEFLLQQKAYRPFFMHGLSHWLGLDVHDVGHYGSSERERPFEAGMVLTVEPGLYISPEAEVPDAYRGIGIRIEDNVLITSDGYEILTASVPKDPDEIEALMQAGWA